MLAEDLRPLAEELRPVRHVGILLLVMVVVVVKVGGKAAVGHRIGRHKHGMHQRAAAATARKAAHSGHVAQLVHPLLLAALVLEPDLDDPHAEACLLGQLLAHQPRRLGCRAEDILQHLQLLGGDVGPRAASLPILALLLVLLTLLSILLLLHLLPLVAARLILLI